MGFINTLNETVSRTGEIRAFTTYREANAWRVTECLGAVAA